MNNFSVCDSGVLRVALLNHSSRALVSVCLGVVLHVLHLSVSSRFSSFLAPLKKKLPIFKGGMETELTCKLICECVSA